MIAEALSTFARYVRLYGRFLEFSFGKAFEFRFDFVMRIIMDIVYYAVALAFFKVIYLHTPDLGGWDERHAMVFVAGSLIVDALNMTIFSSNMWNLPLLINKGELDYYLIRPVSSLFFMSLRDFAASSFINLLCALGILAWALARLPVWPGAGRITLFLLCLLNGTVIFYCLNILANMLVFWTQGGGSGFSEIIWSLSKFGERPDTIYRGVVRSVLTFVLPFAVIASFPARLIIDRGQGDTARLLLHMFGISILFLTIVILTWNRALRSYSSASS